jgi:rhodanese-related sulfurtransferase
VARLLIDKGFTLVRPLAGGFDGWLSAGYAVEADEVRSVQGERPATA